MAKGAGRKEAQGDQSSLTQAKKDVEKMLAISGECMYIFLT
jgi:hypothetical protein